ncbi:hypothetical protein JOC77_002800 [Peribacillus deserti]|uniref:DUF4129 domain-containing protein n=1 Tax=Peribacillus deserti TaxID=673318 RepID=A0ABS2QK23_9BACI|nr:hypothetical protein [Peribacillus deserti]MBM7693360.1 hypothetical protein [Peribacillus deserti]
MLSLLVDFFVQLFSFIVLVKFNNEAIFAALIPASFAVYYLIYKRLLMLLCYCLLFVGSIFFRLALPSVLEWIVLGGVLLLHLFVSSRTKRIGVYRIEGILSASAAGFMLLYIVPFVTTTLKAILSLIATLLAWIVSGPLVFLVGLINFRGGKEMEERLQNLLKKSPEKAPEFTGESGNNILIYSVLAILALVVIFLIIRMAKKRLNIYSLSSITKNISIYEGTSSLPGRLTATKDAVRKIVFNWEKKLAAPYTRNSGESFSAWIMRISSDFLNDLDTNLLISIYSGVRYKDQAADNSDVKKFKQEMNKFAQLRKPAKS